MKCAVAIFAKTVGLSAVKTRLAADIGKHDAEEFYKLSVDCVEAFVAAAGEAFPETVYPVWTVGEEEGVARWASRSFPVMWTGEGGLGSRLASVSEHLFSTYDAVMMIGTDSPQLSPALLIDAISRLAGGVSDVVVGPAADGGFYLFASRRPVDRHIWESVTYSKETTLQELVECLDLNEISVSFLQAEQDVDTLADLRVLRERFCSETDLLSPEHVRLRQWLMDHSALI